MVIAVGPARLGPRLSIRVTGLPEGVVLSAGLPAEGGTWVLSPSDLPGLTLATPREMFGTFKLGLSVNRTDGVRSPGASRTIDVVVAQPAGATVKVAAAASAARAPSADVEIPAGGKTAERVPARPAAPPRTPVAALAPAPQGPAVAVVVQPPAQGQQPDAPAQAGGDVTTMMARGDALFDSGDIASARLLYEYAANAGHVPGAAKLAKAYDPLVIKELQIYGVQPDSKRAQQWYRFAAERGNREAAERLAQLDAWLAKVDRFGK